MDRAVVAYDGRPVLDGVSTPGRPPARSWRSSAPTARASPPWSAPSLGLVPLTAGEVASSARRRAVPEWHRLGYVPQRARRRQRRPRHGGRGRRRPAAWPAGVSCARRRRRPERGRGGAGRRRPRRPGPATRSSALSGGQQQRALIARALAGEPGAAGPRRADGRRRRRQPGGVRRRPAPTSSTAAAPSCWSRTSSARCSP